MTAFTFNRDYHDLDQVAPFTDAYLAVFDELEAGGKFAYNDSFKGRIPGIEGPCEDTAIYLLQSARHLRDHDAQVAAALADGYEPVDTITATTKFASVVEHGFYMGGTGWREWPAARITPLTSGSLAVIPKGRRTHGHVLSGKVLVKR